MNWTKGSWTVNRTVMAGAVTHWHITGEKHGSVYPICAHTMEEQPSGSEQLANAYLIAASPELYEALAGLLLAKEEKDKHGDTPAYRALKIWKWEAAKAALAKARGEV